MEHILTAITLVAILVLMIITILLTLRLREARAHLRVAERVADSYRAEATTARARLAEAVEIAISPKQTFEPDPLSIARLTAQTLKPRPEPSRARPNTASTSGPGIVPVTDTGTTYFNAVTTDTSRIYVGDGYCPPTSNDAGSSAPSSDSSCGGSE